MSVILSDQQDIRRLGHETDENLEWISTYSPRGPETTEGLFSEHQNGRHRRRCVGWPFGAVNSTWKPLLKRTAIFHTERTLLDIQRIQSQCRSRLYPWLRWRLDDEMTTEHLLE